MGEHLPAWLNIPLAALCISVIVGGAIQWFRDDG